MTERSCARHRAPRCGTATLLRALCHVRRHRARPLSAQALSSVGGLQRLAARLVGQSSSPPPPPPPPGSAPPAGASGRPAAALTDSAPSWTRAGEGQAADGAVSHARQRAAAGAADVQPAAGGAAAARPRSGCTLPGPGPSPVAAAVGVRRGAAAGAGARQLSQQRAGPPPQAPPEAAGGAAARSGDAPGAAARPPSLHAVRPLPSAAAPLGPSAGSARPSSAPAPATPQPGGSAAAGLPSAPGPAAPHVAGGRGARACPAGSGDWAHLLAPCAVPAGTAQSRAGAREPLKPPAGGAACASPSDLIKWGDCEAAPAAGGADQAARAAGDGAAPPRARPASLLDAEDAAPAAPAGGASPGSPSGAEPGHAHAAWGVQPAAAEDGAADSSPGLSPAAAPLDELLGAVHAGALLGAGLQPPASPGRAAALAGLARISLADLQPAATPGNGCGAADAGPDPGACRAPAPDGQPPGGAAPGDDAAAAAPDQGHLPPAPGAPGPAAGAEWPCEAGPAQGDADAAPAGGAALELEPLEAHPEHAIPRPGARLTAGDQTGPPASIPRSPAGRSPDWAASAAAPEPAHGAAQAGPLEQAGGREASGAAEEPATPAAAAQPVLVLGTGAKAITISRKPGRPPRRRAPARPPCSAQARPERWRARSRHAHLRPTRPGPGVHRASACPGLASPRL